MPWMTQLFYSDVPTAPLPAFPQRPLSQITLPGTHDSGCYRNQLVSNVLSATQTQDIFHQLAGGIRYFDLRPARHNNDFWTYHGLAYWGGKLTGADGILNQVREYLDSLASSDRELIILNFSHFYKFTLDDHIDLVDAINASLSRYLVPYTQSDIHAFAAPYWQLLAEPAPGGTVPPAVMAGAAMRSRVLILYDGALDTPQEPYVAGLPFTPPAGHHGLGMPGFFVLTPKYAPPANPIQLFDQYSNRGRVDDQQALGQVLLGGIRSDQLNKLRARQNYAYTTQPFNPGFWGANAVGGVPGTLHLLSWTLTPQFSVSTTWEPLTAAREVTNPQLLDLFCGPGRGWAGVCYNALRDPQINIIYVDDYASIRHRTGGSPWYDVALPVAIAARMNVGPVGDGSTW
ncbi:hypothetical protein GTP44_04975 [Duganella sp. FT50W]|uniref:Phosphatidylinositol diacylglycerol-lyase n=1 Tax=Duganella lactea TaxID=2692173 RepID=A0A6L8MGG2_9BURK|nr:hypothetical protein [Duganella lactea]MYM81311.1 hypothetical protein [Duganella lactea]